MKVNYMVHTGVLGMKWGIRRYQNPDGTLTPKGRLRYGKEGRYTYKSKLTAAKEKNANKLSRSHNESQKRQGAKYQQEAEYNREIDRRMQEYSERVSTGKHIALRVLTGGVVGGKGYQTALAIMNGQSAEGITGKKIIAAALAPSGIFADIMMREIAYHISK